MATSPPPPVRVTSVGPATTGENRWVVGSLADMPGSAGRFGPPSLVHAGQEKGECAKM